jgi:hypothetical protein
MKKTTSLLFFLVIATQTIAQVDTAKVVARAPNHSTTFTYYVDGYYKGDFASKPENNKTSFTNTSNSLQLGMASVKLDQVMGNFSATLDLGLGKRTEEFSYNDKGIATSFKQAFISYAPNSTIKFTAGKWATHIGYELLDAYSNRNYSMSYSFSYGPFFHTGLRADIALGGKSAMMIGVAQPTDFVSSSSPNKMLIAQFSTGTKNDKLKAFLNYQGGKSKSQIDLVLNGVVSGQVAINYDGTVCNISGASWSSNAFYVNFDPTAKFGFTWRTEFFDDTKNAAGVGTSIFQNTFSANIHFEKITLIPELRFDNAKDKIFLNNNSNLNPFAGNFLLAAVYKF